MSGTVTFAANSSTADVSVSAIDDAIAEPVETVVVALAYSSQYTAGSSWEATVTISDNETPEVTIEKEYDAFEGWAGRFNLTRTGNTSQQVTVNYTPSGTATPGVDDTALGSSLVIAAGAVSVSLDVAALTDSVADDGETVIVTLQNGTGYVLGSANAATMEIIDNTIPPPRPAPVFDLDVNADNDLDDAVDLAANYLPGYEGTTQKVSTGTSFNSDVYQGQRMKLILDGIGSDTSEVKRIEFVITDVTQYAGYASNRVFTTNVGIDDYSFYWGQDSLDPNQGNKRIITIDRNSNEIVGPNPSGGHMDATKSWVNFYAKDYGGWAQIEARVYVYDGAGEKLARTIPLTVPKDSDNDKLADKWEIAMADRWSDQYPVGGIPDVFKLDLFNAKPGPFPGQDNESKDPDGSALNEQGMETRPLVAQKEEGDGHTVLEEYRGYILDGGGFDGTGNNGFTGGHIRLDPARKEILLEVDRAATVNNIPTGGLSSILNGASKIFSDANRGAGIYMYYLMDDMALDLPRQKLNTDAKIENEAKASRDTAQARAIGGIPNLTTDFLHLMYVDDIGNAGSGGYTLTKSLDLDKRVSVIAVTNLKDNLFGWGLSSDKLNQLLMCATAHEITHMLIERHDGPFNAGEHTIDPNGNGLDDAEDESSLMYKLVTRKRSETGTVRFFPVVQAELRVRTNQALTT